MKSNALTAGCLLPWLVLMGCSRSDPAATTAASGTAPAAGGQPAAPAEQRYPLTGEVVSVDVAKKILVVHHEEVKGYMPSMTMEFAVSAGDAAVAKPGQRIRAEMIPGKDGGIRLEKIWPDDPASSAVMTASARALTEDTHNRGKNAYREIDEKIPNFALYDQDGRVVQSERFHGKQVMLNFIYSRCPIANMCPAATIKMMQVQKLAREAHVANLELVSISLEPSYDTPGVLKEYASVRGIDTSNFSFLTGPEKTIQDLLAQFGVIAEFEGGYLKHTLSTLLIDENGKISHRTDGSQWEPGDFVAKMHKG